MLRRNIDLILTNHADENGVVCYNPIERPPEQRAGRGDVTVDVNMLHYVTYRDIPVYGQEDAVNAYSLTDPQIRQGRFWPVVEACYSRTWDHYDMPPHFHYRAEIMYVLKGECLVHLYAYRTDGDGQQITVTRHRRERLRPGEFILLDQEVLHDLEVPETSYMLNAEFRVCRDEDSPLSLGALARSSHAAAALMEGESRVRRGLDPSGAVLHVLEKIVEAFSRPGDKVLSDVLLAELLLRVADILQDDAINPNARSYVQQAMDYVAEHLCAPLRVGEIAGAVNIAPAYLQRIFRQATDLTLVEYVNRQRVEQAKRLLMFTDDPIVDVAFATGFNSRQHFFRVFNAVVGISPRQFRKEHRAQTLPQTFLFDNALDHSYSELDRHRTDS